MDSYNAVVIGGGIGGLTSAVLLAKKGMRVAVFEKENHPGGYCSSFSTDGYTFDACVDSIGGLRKGEPLRYVIEEKLGIWDKLDTIELNPIRRNVFPDRTLDIPSDVIQYKDILKTIYSSEKNGIDKFFFAMDKIYTASLKTMCGEDDLSLSYDYMEISFYDLLSSFISDERLKLDLSTYCPFMGLPSRDASAIALSNILMHYVKGGAFRIRGGFQKLSDALVDELKSNGGEIFVNEAVTSVIYDGARATGVSTKNIREIKAEHIISNINIKTALKMMNGCAVDKKRVGRIEDMKVSGSFIIVYLGVKDDLRNYDMPSNIGFFNSYNIDEMLNNRASASFGISFPSLLDSSVASKGRGSVVIHWPLCYIENTAEIDKNLIYDKLITELNKLVPGIADKIEYKSVSSPTTLERYTGNTHGAAYGWEQKAGFLKNLPILHNIAENFHIVGHWAGYGGGVMPSMLSACKVINKIAK